MLSLPILIALAVSVPRAMSVPRKYMGATSVWFDNAIPQASSLDAQQYYTIPPAQQGQAVLQELLTTRQFLVAVGRRGPLAAQLAAQRTRPSHAAVDQQLVDELGPAFSSYTSGSQVLHITMTSTNPSIIAGTLDALVRQYTDQITTERTNRDRSSLSYFSTRLDTAKHALDTATGRVVSYERVHPAATPASDPALSQLTQDALGAQQTYSDLQTSYTQANLAFDNAGAVESFHVIDPVAELVQLSRKKTMIVGGVAGLLMGVLVSALALVALTLADRSPRRPEDIEESLGLDVVASIDEVGQKRARGDRQAAWP